MLSNKLMILILLLISSHVWAEHKKNQQDDSICPIELTYLQETFPLKHVQVFNLHPLRMFGLKPGFMGAKNIWTLSGETYITCQYRNTLSTVMIHLPDVKQCQSTRQNYQRITCKK